MASEATMPMCLETAQWFSRLVLATGAGTAQNNAGRLWVAERPVPRRSLVALARMLAEWLDDDGRGRPGCMEAMRAETAQNSAMRLWWRSGLSEGARWTAGRGCSLSGWVMASPSHRLKSIRP